MKHKTLSNTYGHIEQFVFLDMGIGVRVVNVEGFEAASVQGEVSAGWAIFWPEADVASLLIHLAVELNDNFISTSTAFHKRMKLFWKALVSELALENWMKFSLQCLKLSNAEGGSGKFYDLLSYYCSACGAQPGTGNMGWTICSLLSIRFIQAC